MINYKVKIDKYGNELIEYSVLKGDTFPMSISLSSQGNNVSRETISSVIYKQADEEYNEVYRQDLAYDETTGKYVLIVPSEITASFSEEITYIYEIEVTLIDGTVVTPTQSKIKFTSEIVK